MARGTDPEPSRRRIGVFGGSFDPPHCGHVSAARDVADQLSLDEVLWVPAARSPHKRHAPRVGDAPRLAMVRAAVASDARFLMSEAELRRGGASYTVETLRELRTDGYTTDADVYLILGFDQYRAFERWREPDGIRALATLAIMDREGDSVEPSRTRPGTVRVPVRRVDVSSTTVRARARAGQDIGGLVPAGVREIIIRDALYGD